GERDEYCPEVVLPVGGRVGFYGTVVGPGRSVGGGLTQVVLLGGFHRGRPVGVGGPITTPVVGFQVHGVFGVDPVLLPLEVVIHPLGQALPHLVGQTGGTEAVRCGVVAGGDHPASGAGEFLVEVGVVIDRDG